MLDEVMATCMLAPNSYTCEDTVEIYGHGGTVSLQAVLKALLSSGARAAEPGEFTLRAFLNGRIDLSQAEAVRDVIEAKTDAGLRVAMNGLQGGLSGKVRDVRTTILEVLAYLTARIDFPEDDVPVEDPLPAIRKAAASLDKLISSADAGIVYRHGVRVAIVGRPNVGKSSLLNRLLEQERAIVTPIAGTTRDTVEEVANIQGIPFVLVDTAGLTETSDPVEHLGIERSRKALSGADMAILVLDSSQPLTEEDTELIGGVNGKSVVTVSNKSDLPGVVDSNALPGGAVRTSMVTGEGLGIPEKSDGAGGVERERCGVGGSAGIQLPTKGRAGVCGRTSGVRGEGPGGRARRRLRDHRPDRRPKLLGRNHWRNGDRRPAPHHLFPVLHREVGSGLRHIERDMIKSPILEEPKAAAIDGKVLGSSYAS